MAKIEPEGGRPERGEEGDREALEKNVRRLQGVPFFEAEAERILQLVRQRKEDEALAREVQEAEEEEAQQNVGFSARLLVQATLPHSKPRNDALEFSRSNGIISMKVVADAKYGLPYGTYPRLLLAWMTTEAVRTRSPQLELGDSLAAFMTKLDLVPTGGSQGSIRRLRHHMLRLFTSSVSAEIELEGEKHRVGFCPVERFSVFWDPKNPEQGGLWKSRLQLAQLFFNEITKRPVPVDMAALRTLTQSRSPLAIDIYQWLTFRMSYLKRPTTIPWAVLQLQFGSSEHLPARDFKRKFVRRLQQVLAVYPQARVEPTPAGLRLHPSPTSIPMRLIKSSH